MADGTIRLSGSAERARRIAVVDVPCPLDSTLSGTAVAQGRDWEYDTCANRFTFLECANPHLIWLTPRPVTEALPVIYPPTYNAFNYAKMNMFVRYGRAFIQRKKARSILTGLSRNARLIDIGCGEGGLLRAMQGLNSGLELWANDMSAEAVAPLADLGMTVAVGRFETADIPNGYFDCLVMNQVIEHVADPRGLLAKAASVLRPGGRVFVETPCLAGLDFKLFRGGHWGNYHIPRHWTLFSREALEQMGRELGLEPVTYAALSSPSSWINSFHNMFLDRWPRLGIHRFFTIRNPLLLAFFVTLDMVVGRFGQTSNMRVVFRRPAQVQG